MLTIRFIFYMFVEIKMMYHSFNEMKNNNNIKTLRDLISPFDRIIEMIMCISNLLNNPH